MVRFWNDLLKILPIPSIHSKPAILVTRTTHRPFWVELIFNLDRLALRGGNICGERYQQIAGNSLLDGYARPGILSVVCSQCRIDLQLRHAGQLGNLATHLAADA